MLRWTLTVLIPTAAFVWASAAGATIITYDYAADLVGVDQNNDPVVSTATGSFSYDDTAALGGGFFSLTEISFSPEPITQAGDLICDPVFPNCFDVTGEYARFNPSTSDLEIFLNELDGASYHLDYDGGVGGFGVYSDNNAFGDWTMTSLDRSVDGGDVPAVPEPTAALLFAVGTVLVSGWSRRRRT